MANDIQRKYFSSSSLWERWEIKFKLIIGGFLTVAFIIAVVGFYAFSISKQITKSFEGGKKHFRSVTTSATQLSSYVKRAEDHLMLYLALHREINKQKFTKRVASLYEQISILDSQVRNPEARSTLDKIKLSTSEILPLGNALIDSHDRAIEKTGRFDIEKYQETVIKLHNATSATREFAVALADIEIRLKDNIRLTVMAKAKRIQYNILIVIISSVIFALFIGYFLFKMVNNLKKEVAIRRQAEKTLQESEEKYRLLVNTIPSIVYKGYKDWSVDFFDEKIESLTGYNVDEFNSRRIKWIDIIVERDIEAAKKIFIRALKTNKSYVREYRIISKTGDIHWIQERGQIVYDNKGDIEYVNGIIFDISDRKQMQEELLKAKKLETVGILAGGIAHDFNNLLTIIIGNIELAEDDIKPEVGVSECLEEAEKACIQAQALTTQLITFSKGGAPVKEIGSIEDILTTTINSIIANSNVRCDFLISNDLWQVEFDHVQMRHAIKNLIVNAVESMPDGGLIKVRAENCIISSEIAHQVLFVSEGNYVKISIQDHGVGIPEKHLSQIFDPYFSTKNMGIQKGMGLGLSTTYSIINRHNGCISVESRVGIGTIFTLFLPAGKKDIRELPLLERHKPEKTEIRTRRILLMDDEEGIRKLSKQRLNQLGYETELAKDGSQAIDLYKKAMDSGRPFDAVILDLTVKRGMGGKDAVKALLKIDPQVNAIVSNGYSNDPVMTDFRAYGFTGSLAKPNKKEDLIEALKKIIKK
jgi:PAS domain S-box-containing protein